MACEFCTGSRYLSDLEALGRCVCVTPEAFRDMDLELAAVRKAMRLDPEDDTECAALNYVEAVDGVFSSLSAGRDKTGDPLGLVDAVDKALDELADQGDVADALSAYLVSIGQPAVPAGALGNPALEHLVSLIL